MERGFLPSPFLLSPGLSTVLFFSLYIVYDMNNEGSISMEETLWSWLVLENTQTDALSTCTFYLCS